MAKPKGHKRGCKCAVCARPRARAGAKRNAAARPRSNPRARFEAGDLVKWTAKFLRSTGRSTAPVDGLVLGPAPDRSDWVLVMWSDSDAANPVATANLQLKRKATPATRATARREARSAIARGIGQWMDAAELESYLAGFPNPVRPKKRNSTVRLAGNPQHLPRTAAGRKGRLKYWIFDLYGSDGDVLKTEIGRHIGIAARDRARDLSRGRVGRRTVAKVQLSGPYARKPGVNSVRK